METINENNLSISEFEDISELSAEELEVIAGGKFWWDDMKDALDKLVNPHTNSSSVWHWF